MKPCLNILIEKISAIAIIIIIVLFPSLSNNPTPREAHLLLLLLELRVKKIQNVSCVFWGDFIKQTADE